MDKDYIRMYNILDYCYYALEEETKKEKDDIGFSEYDYLALLLGVMVWSPDGLPIDLAICEDWDLISSKHSMVLEKIIAFLTLYEDDYGCNFEKTKCLLLGPKVKEIKEIKEILES